MAAVLTIWGLIKAGAYGVIALGPARGAVLEIEAGFAFLIATVAIGCAGIIETVKKSGKTATPTGRVEFDETTGHPRFLSTSGLTEKEIVARAKNPSGTALFPHNQQQLLTILC